MGKVIARYHIFLVLFASRSAFCFASCSSFRRKAAIKTHAGTVTL